MVDMHTHLLPGVDDGSYSIKESLGLIKIMADLGFSKIILTPHYIKGSEYSSNLAYNQRIFRELQKSVKYEKIPIALSLGNEIFFSDDILKQIEAKIISPLNGKFLLIELPFQNEINNLLDNLYELALEDYKIIIAHPERYDFVQRNPKTLQKFQNEGILFQGNFESLTGKYGKKAKKTIKYLLDQKMIDFMGTDTHHLHTNTKYILKKSINKLKKRVSSEYFHYLTTGGAFYEKNN